MLFTEEETADWKRRETEAAAEQPGDGWGAGWKRKEIITKAARVEKVKRMRARPDRVLRFIVISVSEKCALGFTPKELWGESDSLEQRYEVANTPENRWIILTILRGIQKIPSSWGRSAALRFFRGIGKQKTIDLPGAGILSAERGWTTNQANAMVEIFYDSEISPLFVKDVTSEVMLDRDEIDEIYDAGGNPHAIVQNEKDKKFIAMMIEAVEKQEIIEPLFEVKEKKVYVQKVLKPGIIITQNNVRDLVPGSHLEMSEIDYDMGWGHGEEFGGVSKVYDLVVVGRTVGELLIRPILKGVAFAQRSLPSSHLYKSGYGRNCVETKFVGPWVGQDVDVEIGRDAWKPRTSKKVLFRREGKYPDVKITQVK